MARSTKATPRATNVVRIDQLLESLRRDGAFDTRDEALGQLALTLAAQLDDGAGMATAAVARELRATLADLTKDRSGDDDDDDWSAQLPAAVRNPEES